MPTGVGAPAKKLPNRSTRLRALPSLTLQESGRLVTLECVCEPGRQGRDPGQWFPSRRDSMRGLLD